MNQSTPLRRIVAAIAFGAMTIGLALIQAPSARADESAKLLAEVKAAWEKREEAARTVRVEWSFKNFTPKGALDAVLPTFPQEEPDAGKPMLPRPPTDSTHDGWASLLMDGTKARLRLEEYTWTNHSSTFRKRMVDSTYDDVASSTSDRFAEERSELVTIKKAKWNTACDVNTVPIRMAFRGTNPAIMKGRDIAKYSNARAVTHDGRQVIEAVRERNETDGEGYIWLDPAQDYAAVRAEEYNLNGVLEYRINIKNKQITGGIWVPAEWTTTVYTGQKLFRRIQTTVRETAIGISTDTEDFILRLGDFAHVCDYTGEHPREYITREGKPPREILPSEAGSDYVDLARTEPGELARGGAPGFVTRNQTLLILTGLGLILAAVLLLFGRGVFRASRDTQHPFGPNT